MKSLFFLSLFVSSMIVNAGQISTVEAKPECYDVFYGKKDRVYLTGEWKHKKMLCTHKDYFKVVREHVDLTVAGINTDDWGKILIPNYIDVHSKRKQDTGAVFLRKDFKLKKLDKNRRYLLTFWGVSWEPIVYVNGKKVVELKNLMPGRATEFFKNDITKYIQAGTNNITVCVFTQPRFRRLTSGIYAPVFIEVVNLVYAQEMLIQTQLPNKVNVKCIINNTSGKTVNSDITTEIIPWKGEGATTVVRLGKHLLKPGENKLNFTAKIKNPVLWDTDNPFLYSLKLKVADKTAGWERFGIREFKIKGKIFYLNNKKINLYGINSHENQLNMLMYDNCAINPQFINNSRGALRKYLKLLKEHNCNSIIRLLLYSKTWSDICDELGILTMPWVAHFVYSYDLPLWVKRMMVADGFELPEIQMRGFFYKKVNGKLQKYGKEIYDIDGRNEYLRLLYRKAGKLICNNPSAVGVTNGSENFRIANQAFDMPLMRKSLYEICPGMVFAGTHGMAAQSKDLDGKWVPIVPAQDFVNFAGVNCGGASMNVCHFSMYPYTLKWRYEAINKDIYNHPLPSYAGECFYYGIIWTAGRKGLWDWTLKSFSPMYPGGKLDKEQMVKILSRPAIEKVAAIDNRYERKKYIRKEVKGTWWPFRATIKLVGLQANALDKNVIYRFIGKRLKKMVEMVRMYDQYMQGTGTVTSPWGVYDMEKLAKLNPDGIQPGSPVGETFKLVYSPLFTCLSLYDNRHSFIAGDKFDTKVFAFNNSRNNAGNVSVKVVVSQNKNIYFQKSIDYGLLKVGDKLIKKIRIPFSNKLKTGDCNISLEMFSGNKKILNNNYQVYTLSEKDANPSVDVADSLYILNGRNKSTNKQLAKLLGRIRGVNVKYIENLEKLDKIKFLVMAPRVLTEANKDNFTKLKPWLENGGRLLVLEQKYIGAFPWLPKVQNVKLRHKFEKYFTLFGIDLMPVDVNYPAFHKVGKRHYWNTLNNKYGEVYRTLLAPIDMDTQAIGASIASCEYAMSFGSLLIDKKVGKGLCVMSQVEAVKALAQKDAVATKYLLNLLLYLINKKGDVK